MEEIYFVIEKDDDDTFFAKSLGYSIFTQGDSEEEIKSNILDAVNCHFENPPKLIRLHFVKDEVLEYA